MVDRRRGSVVERIVRGIEERLEQWREADAALKTEADASSGGLRGSWLVFRELE